MANYPKRILIVEDNKVDVRLLKDILEGRGYETLRASDGLEAINLAFENLPDLILMDIQLPEISGLEVTRRLRGNDRSRRIPIIAVTAFAMGWHEREVLDSGCDAYISKPISIPRFLRTVESFLPPESCCREAFRQQGVFTSHDSSIAREPVARTRHLRVVHSA
jgi:two-component system, cell cycle response regulator DivK